MLPIASWAEWRDNISHVRGYSNLICLPVTIFCPVPIPDLGWVPFTCSHSLTSSPPSSSSAWSLPGTQHIREAQFSSCSQTCAVHEIKSWSHNQSWRRKVFETWGIFFLSWVMFVIITWAALLGYLPHKHKVSTSSAFRVTKDDQTISKVSRNELQSLAMLWMCPGCEKRCSPVLNSAQFCLTFPQMGCCLSWNQIRLWLWPKTIASTNSVFLCIKLLSLFGTGLFSNCLQLAHTLCLGNQLDRSKE